MPDKETDTLRNHVVWVDEQPRLRQAIELFFGGHDIEASTAPNAVEAFEVARVAAPKVLVLHNLSPALENYALCAAVRADPALRHAFVMVGTGPYGEDDMSDLLHCGADLTIERPLDPDVLLDIVQNVFEGRLLTKPRKSGPKRKIHFLDS